MAYINTISEEQAVNLNQELYKTARENLGYVPNYVKLFSLRPEVYEAWTKLLAGFRSHMRLRRYELLTFATAVELECTYCSLAHATVLRKNFFSADQLIAIVKDYRSADLTEEEVALISFAKKISRRASDVSEEDMAFLRQFGLKDEEILDVVLTVTARNFFSKTLDSLDARPEDKFLELEPELIQVLTRGRPFSAKS
ncbi:MAG TPA: peroxidase-related enzyme [Anaerolineaceae bacterium]|nr:peroxidase-related enzyme [Anaerolineaceae bacterium]